MPEMNSLTPAEEKRQASSGPKEDLDSLNELAASIEVASGENLSDEDLFFVQECRALLTRQRAGWTGLLAWVSLFFVAALLAWASWAELEEVTRGVGKVVSSSSVQMIQSLEGGILDELSVKEGDEVEKGQKLLRIQDTIFEASYQENLARRDVLRARLARLHTEAQGLSRIEFSPGVREDLAVLESTLFEKRHRDLEVSRTSLQKRLQLAREEEKLLAGAESSGAVSPVELIRIRKEIAELEGNLDILLSTHEREAMEQYDEDHAELEFLLQALKKDKDRLDRTVMNSPVRGTVNKIYIDTEGRIVGSGMDIMEIVPLGDTLLIEANVKPSDIAFMRPGQKARVRFTAYDFSVYGGLDGKLEQIGADTVQDENGESFYQIKVRTEKSSLGKDRHGQEMTIIPGMVAEVDIMTGKKSILSYMLKPLTRAKERALREK